MMGAIPGRADGPRRTPHARTNRVLCLGRHRHHRRDLRQLDPGAVSGPSRGMCGGPSSTASRRRPGGRRDRRGGRCARASAPSSSSRWSTTRCATSSPARTARAWCWTCSAPSSSRWRPSSASRATTASAASPTPAKSQEYTTASRPSTSALAHDDGQSARNLDIADVILVGVSRSGKTPTSLYLAMQHGIKAANYPLIPDDFERHQLPSTLAPYKRKCFGLTIDPDRLARSATSAARQQVRVAGELPLRSATRPSDDAPRRHCLAVVDAQVDRGDRHHHPARPAPGPADLLIRRA
jgi:hypothetical protein